MPTLGQELRRERELRGIALVDIAKMTKVKLSFLQALEEDRLDVLPGEFFIKGILRAYAKSIGLDENQALNLYLHSTQQPDRARPSERVRADRTPIKVRRMSPALMVAAFVLIAAAAVVTYLIIDRNRGKSIPQPTPTQTAVKPAEVPAPVKQSPPAAQATGLTLEITFQQETWIQVFADGRSVLDQIKYPDETFVASCRKEFVLNAGNAGGFTYTLNGRPGRPLGRSWAVVKNIRITKDTLGDFWQQKP